jgi:hypothetical protein
MKYLALNNIFHQAGDPKVAHFHLPRKLRPQPSTNYIHQDTVITQRYDQQSGKVRQHHRVATNLGAIGNISNTGVTVRMR